MFCVHCSVFIALLWTPIYIFILRVVVACVLGVFSPSLRYASLFLVVQIHGLIVRINSRLSFCLLDSLSVSRLSVSMALFMFGAPAFSDSAT
jgi:hypothetical protein